MKTLLKRGTILLVLLHMSSGHSLGALMSMSPIKDSTLYQSSSGALSNGAGEYFSVGRTNQAPGANLRRSLIAFDIAGNVPAGSTINRVILTLHLSRAGNDNLNEIGLHRVLTDWGEGASDAPGSEGSGTDALPGDATWLHTFFDTDFWSNPGGDFVLTASTFQAVGGLGTYTWGSSLTMENDVQLWLDNPSEDFGWLLLGNEVEPGIVKRFDTRENLDPLNRPVLTIDYTPIPEPGTLLLLASGLAGLIHLKRKRKS